MVWEEYEKNLGAVISPGTWKDGTRDTTESGIRKPNENKAPTSKKARFDPYGKNTFSTCRLLKFCVPTGFSLLPGLCLQKVHLCHAWKKVLDTPTYKQTSVLMY